MKVFISWSGARSRNVAAALNDWLCRVIQAVQPFFSPEIEKGAKWSGELDAALEDTHFGIVCLTPDNLDSTWIHYEAGALAKTKDAMVWTFLHGITAGDVRQPLGRFQHTVAEKEDVLRLLMAINARLGEIGGSSLQSQLLRENFEIFWPMLEERLRAAETIAPKAVPEKGGKGKDGRRDVREILEEVLELLRNQERSSGESAKQESKREKHTGIRIAIVNERDAEDIAVSLKRAFYTFDLVSRVEILDSHKWPILTVEFKMILQNEIVSGILEKVSKDIGYRISNWDTFLSY